MNGNLLFCLDGGIELIMDGITLEHMDHVIEVKEGLIDGCCFCFAKTV